MHNEGISLTHFKFKPSFNKNEILSPFVIPIDYKLYAVQDNDAIKDRA